MLQQRWRAGRRLGRKCRRRSHCSAPCSGLCQGTALSLCCLAAWQRGQVSLVPSADSILIARVRRWRHGAGRPRARGPAGDSLVAISEGARRCHAGLALFQGSLAPFPNLEAAGGALRGVWHCFKLKLEVKNENEELQGLPRSPLAERDGLTRMDAQINPEHTVMDVCLRFDNYGIQQAPPRATRRPKFLPLPSRATLRPLMVIVNKSIANPQLLKC